MPDESWTPAKAQMRLRIQSFSVPVSDLHRSLEFYETTLGFRVLRRHIDVAPGIAFAAVAPTDGTAVLLLSTADPDNRMGTATGVSFVTTDLDTQHREWAKRGVRFSHQPRQVAAEVRVSTFLDPDDNAFLLNEVNSIATTIEAEHRARAERADRDRRAAHELEIATQVQAGLFPSQRPVMRTLDYAGVCLQARQVGGDYFDFLDCGDGRLGLVIGDVSGKGLGAACSWLICKPTCEATTRCIVTICRPSWRQ